MTRDLLLSSLSSLDKSDLDNEILDWESYYARVVVIRYDPISNSVKILNLISGSCIDIPYIYIIIMSKLGEIAYPISGIEDDDDLITLVNSLIVISSELELKGLSSSGAGLFSESLKMFYLLLDKRNLFGELRSIIFNCMKVYPPYITTTDKSVGEEFY